MRYPSPLRYPGGKGKLGPWIKDIMRRNNISGGVYLEPYAGGAGAGLFLLLNLFIDYLFINDIDRRIFSFWYSILNYTEEFIDMIYLTPIDIDTWLNMKEVLNNPSSDTFSLGFATFYVNRTSTSGILSANPIGGINQDGQWKIDARFNKDGLVNRIRNIAKFKSSIIVFNNDALSFMQSVERSLPDKHLFFLDPPYYHKANDLYTNHYSYNDHLEVAQQLKQTSSKWLLTYDDVEPIRQLYSWANGGELDVTYSASPRRRRRANEVYFHSQNLVVAPLIHTH